MTITLNAALGDAAANSYITLAEANTYLEAHMQASVWSALDDERKKAALISATRQLETERFGGRRVAASQSLAWPRQGLRDSDGYGLVGIPLKLLQAECELAMWNLTEEDRLAGDFEIDNMDSVEIGPIKYTIGAKAEAFPRFIRNLLESMGPAVISGTSVEIMVL